MDDLLIIIFSSLATALVVAPIAFRLGVRHKDRRWRSALDQFETSGIGIKRRSNQ